MFEVRKPDPETDAAVARACGWLDDWEMIPSIEPGHAVRALEATGTCFQINYTKAAGWVVFIGDPSKRGFHGDTLSEAACRAVLAFAKVRGEEEEESDE